MQRTEESSYLRRGDHSVREQRSGAPDRRSGLDRRGGGGTWAPQSHAERPYAFRDFNDRRGRQDRRLYCGAAKGEPHKFVYLTREELATLLSEIDG
jgi:hypothetical protein